jgi:hypothetical protein
VTWNNQPGGAAGTPATLTIPAIVGCISVDVKALVQSWVGGAVNHGLRITDQDETTAVHVDYGTREHILPGFQPSLTVTYTAP